jgi:hypothetical protein
MGAKSPRTPPCTPGKRTRRSRSTPKSEKTEVRRAPPGKAAVEVAVDTFERMATRHLFALHDVSEAKSALEAAAQVRDTTRDTTARVVPPPLDAHLFPAFSSRSAPRAAGGARGVVGVRLRVLPRVRRHRRGGRRVRVPRDAPRRLRAPRRRCLHPEAEARGRTRRRRDQEKGGGGVGAAPRGSRLSARRRRLRPRRRGSRRRRVRVSARDFFSARR